MAKNKNSIERVIKLVTSLKVINICWNTVKSTVLIHLFKSSTTNAPVLSLWKKLNWFLCLSNSCIPKFTLSIRQNSIIFKLNSRLMITCSIWETCVSFFIMNDYYPHKNNPPAWGKLLGYFKKLELDCIPRQSKTWFSVLQQNNVNKFTHLPAKIGEVVASIIFLKGKESHFEHIKKNHLCKHDWTHNCFVLGLNCTEDSWLNLASFILTSLTRQKVVTILY